MYTPEVQSQFEKLKTSFEKCLNFLNSELAGMKAGRATPAILDKVLVDYYGTPTPIKSMANMAVTDARTLTISLWDVSMIKEVNKAILAANIGINPNDDGKVIRLVFPVLTEERRKELVKQVRQTGETAKTSLRASRRDILDFCKKQKTDKLISEDDMASIEREVQKLIDAAALQVDGIISEKEKDILTV